MLGLTQRMPQRSPCMARKQLELPLGTRVRHAVSKVPGLVVGRPELTGLSFSLVPITLEGSTRTELWPDHMVESRPKRDQPVALGGQFKAPEGYPLRTRSSARAK